MHFSKSVSKLPQRNRSAHALEPPGVEMYLGAGDQIFRFSENWLANYHFSPFSRLPNYEKKTEKNIIYTPTYTASYLPFVLCTFSDFFGYFVGNFENDEK